MSDVGLQIEAGPFAQAGTTGNSVWWSMMQADMSDTGATAEARLHYHMDPEQAKEAARNLREFAGALERQAELALAYKRAQPREVTF